MKYEQAREMIESGDVLAFTHRSWDTLKDLQVQAVRLFTQSEYSHVGIAWVIAGRVFILEAVSEGVRIFPLSRCGGFYWIQRGRFTSANEETAMLHVGDPYSKIDAVLSFFGADDKENVADFCSKYVCTVLDIKLDRPMPSVLVQYLLEVEGLPLLAVTVD